MSGHGHVGSSLLGGTGPRGSPALSTRRRPDPLITALKDEPSSNSHPGGDGSRVGCTGTNGRRRSPWDAKAGYPTSQTDPRVVKLASEAWRHAKAIAATKDSAALTDAGIDPHAAGVLTGDPAGVGADLIDLLAGHRCGDRFATSADL